MTEILSRRDRFDLSGSDQPPPLWRVCLVLMRVSAMNNEIDTVEGVLEEMLISLDHECGRHYARGISQHSIFRNDSKAFNAN
jgi:hypothetical protein